MGYGPKLPLCKPKAGVHDILNQWEVKDSQEPWPNGFCVIMPLFYLHDIWLCKSVKCMIM